MIVVTGAAGFIGSYLIAYLNKQGHQAVLAVDDFSRRDKLKNLQNKKLAGMVHRADFHQWLAANHRVVGQVFHLGARTDTTEMQQSIFDDLNLNYSKEIWTACTKFEIPLTYASSAATYGDGSQGYDDQDDGLEKLAPLNPYGASKHQFDQWAVAQDTTPPRWHGLKFFNVYGPNEYHKGRMASVILHAYRQIKDTGRVKLFRSHRPEIPDGHQSRDFIFVADVADICSFCMLHRPPSGIYNVGTGKARNFLDLVLNTFKAMDKSPQIDFIDTPLDIREKYQYFTQANMHKLHTCGYNHSFTTLEDGVNCYVANYLSNSQYA